MSIKILDVSTKKPYCSSNRGGAKPKFLVLHYSGTPGASGKSLAIRFARPYVEENDRLSSAHYVVDAGKVYLAVPVARSAWHVGDGKPVRAYRGYRNAVNWHSAHPDFRGNRSSIGVELACDKADRRSKRAEDTDWTIAPETLATAAELCAWLCHKYDIPVANILRHYDCTGKPCPRPLVSISADGNGNNDANWAAFCADVETRLATGGSHADS